MRRFITIAIVVVAALAALFFFGRFRAEQARAESLANLLTQPAERDSLIATVGATGVVRSNQSATLVWQTSGTVNSVAVRPGDVVAVGDRLAEFRLTSLPQNVILAQADLVSAQQALEALLDTDLQEAQALKAVEDAEQALEDALNPELQQANALTAIADAEKAVEDAERQVQIQQTSASQADIDAQKAQVILARDALERAQDQFEPYANKPEDNLIRANLQARLSAAQQEYDAAVRKLNGLVSTGNPVDIAVAEANLLRARAELDQAYRDYESIKDGPSLANVALLEAQLKDAQENLADLQDGPAADDIAAAEARVAAAQATLDSAFISAPFSGVISEVVVKPGDQVSAGTVAFRLDDLSHLLVDVEVSEVDINRIQSGQDVVLTFDAVLAREYRGVVTEVALVGTTVQGVVSFKVTVELLDADENVRAGMTAAVNLVVSQLEDVLVVPNRAVRTLNGERVVYVVRAGSPEPVPVTIELGASSDSFSEVLGGELAEGDQVVLNPPTDFGAFFGGGPPGGN
jgi:HlyD family secretion protein